MSQRQQQKEATRKKLVLTAIRVFAEQGFATPTSVIATQAGVSHGTVFAHFPTREELLRCVLQIYFDKLGARLHELVDDNGSMEEVLTAHVSVLEGYERLYTRLVQEITTLPTDTRDSFYAFQTVIAHHFSQVAEREIARGNLRDIPIHMLFNTWMGLLQYYLQNSGVFAPEDSVLHRHGGELVRTYLLLTQPESKEDSQ